MVDSETRQSSQEVTGNRHQASDRSSFTALFPSKRAHGSGLPPSHCILTAQTSAVRLSSHGACSGRPGYRHQQGLLGIMISCQAIGLS